MDRTIVKVTTLDEQDEAFCLSLSLDDRLRVQEELNRQGRILAGYPASAPMNRQTSRRSGAGSCSLRGFYWHPSDMPPHS